MISLFDENRFPYIIARNRFKIDLIDLSTMKIHSLGSEMNTSNLNPKLRVATVLDKKTSAHRIDIYYNA